MNNKCKDLSHNEEIYNEEIYIILHFIFNITWNIFS